MNVTFDSNVDSGWAVAKGDHRLIVGSIEYDEKHRLVFSISGDRLEDLDGKYMVDVHLPIDWNAYETNRHQEVQTH